MSTKELDGKQFVTFDINAIEADALQDGAYERTGQAGRTLVITDDINIVLIVMRKGAHMKEHDARSAVSIYLKRGKIELELPGERVNLSAGEVLVLERQIPHDVLAFEDSAFILTLGPPAEGLRG